MTAVQFCTFAVGGRRFGIEVEHVQEVMLPVELTPVPLAPATVTGLLNLRGQIVTAIDLGLRLGLGAASGGGAAMNVVVRVDDEVVSLLVDEIGDVIEVSADVIERPPEALLGAARSLVKGVCKLPDGLVLALDVRKTLTLAG